MSDEPSKPNKPNNPSKPTTRRDEDTLVKDRVKRPQRFKVVLHNDDYTPMDFVVELLETIFHRTAAQSTRIMLLVHRTGIGVAGTYSLEVAEAKSVHSIQLARDSGYPLLVTTEPE